MVTRKPRETLVAVDDVSLLIERGETLGVVGESGSGKSTLGRLLLQLERPTSGDILFEGRSIVDASANDRRRLRKRVQVVFQDPYSSLNPTMTVRQIGRKGTSRAKNPQLQFDLRTRPGDANVRSLSVTLSNAFEIDQRHLGNICSEKELTEKGCAGRTPIGRATTTTPLLDQPLGGPVFAVSGSGGLPRLAFLLQGQVTIVPRAKTTTVDGRLKTTVPVVPDAPIGHFRLFVYGGKKGYLVNTRDICRHRPRVAIDYKAQNGDVLSEKVAVRTACGKKKGK
jgi:ABC-type Fe3+/spermidine/putrescine transport system ATPase subunit